MSITFMVLAFLTLVAFVVCVAFIPTWMYFAFMYLTGASFLVLTRDVVKAEQQVMFLADALSDRKLLYRFWNGTSIYRRKNRRPDELLRLIGFEGDNFVLRCVKHRRNVIRLHPKNMIPVP